MRQKITLKSGTIAHGQCFVCKRTIPMTDDWLLIEHQNNMQRCEGSGAKSKYFVGVKIGKIELTVEEVQESE